MRLKRSFFNRDTNIVAQELLGKFIVVKKEDREDARAIIIETEAYHGVTDRASHASRGKTERNRVMFDKAGLVYVYLVYGMYWCLNFTTMPEGFPAAVLVRSIAIEKSKIKNKKSKTQIKNIKIDNKKYFLINGPGRVTKFLGIDKPFYGEDLTKSKRIWIESVGAYGNTPKNDIIKSKRIGVDYAGECKEWEWNYKLNIK